LHQSPGCDRIIRQISRNQPGKFVVQLFSGRHAILKAALSRIKSSLSGPTRDLAHMRQ
jgi:hypothetical protein